MISYCLGLLLGHILLNHDLKSDKSDWFEVEKYLHVYFMNKC